MEKKPRIAQGKIPAELRAMEVGDVVRFPADKYKYTSVRSAPFACMVNERMDGARWTTRINYEEKCVDVTRTA